ncbi:SDR family oxidoreductase [Lentisphaerota bacterium ZTH]|nr:SDR family oxidoreductase [Lentisphaerota bacterium]WET07210.1 SDR family oxidoreductase [Lentisphaerota bacterium ZTH]
MTSIIRNSRILVTGGAGFIGSNLIETLLKGENEVVCLDNFITGKPENLKEFMSSENFSLIEGSICDRKICEKACDGVDYVLHQAALGSVPRSIKDPVATNDINVGGFVNMLWAAVQAKVKRFVYASSSSVYGDSPGLPKVEPETGRPLSPYALTKSINEQYAKIFGDSYGLETVGLRYFNVFGPRQDPYGAYAAVIPRFVLSLMRHEAPVINGDGSFSRDFTYVSNVVQANQKAALTVAPDAIGEAFNIACGGRIDLNELFNTIRGELGCFDKAIAGIEAEHGPFRDGDIPHSLADVSAAMQVLGYIPEVKFADGLATCAEWYWKNYKELV